MEGICGNEGNPIPSFRLRTSSTCYITMCLKNGFVVVGHGRHLIKHVPRPNLSVSACLVFDLVSVSVSLCLGSTRGYLFVCLVFSFHSIQILVKSSTHLTRIASFLLIIQAFKDNFKTLASSTSKIRQLTRPKTGHWQKNHRNPRKLRSRLSRPIVLVSAHAYIWPMNIAFEHGYRRFFTNATNTDTGLKLQEFKTMWLMQPTTR